MLAVLPDSKDTNNREQLKKDDNLRGDLDLQEMTDEAPQSWDELKGKVRTFIRPEQNPDPELAKLVEQDQGLVSQDPK